MVFVGTYEHAIDAKNRLAVPREIRAAAIATMRADGDEAEISKGGGGIVFYVTPGEDDSLCIYTEKTFRERAEQLDQSERDEDEVLDFESLFYGLSRRVETDSQGRVRLPDNLLSRVSFGSEVVLIGMKDHVRIRDRAAWNEWIEQAMARGAGRVLNPRKMVRRKKDAD